MNLDDLDSLLRDGLQRFATAGGLDALKAAEVEVLGRSARLTEFNKGLGAFAPEERKAAGARINTTRLALTEAAAARRTELPPASTGACSAPHHQPSAAQPFAHGCRRALDLKPDHHPILAREAHRALGGPKGVPLARSAI